MSGWPEHLCQVVSNGGYRCHLDGTRVLQAETPSVANINSGAYLLVCRQHMAKGTDDLLAAGAGWVSVVPMIEKEV